MDDVMYGMMPSAKMVICRKLRPLNRSMMPSTEPRFLSKISVRSAVLIPGVGMCAPMRYTASSDSVNSRRLRSSGIRKIFVIDWKRRFMTRLRKLLRRQ